jgi:hypothetical protein
MERSIALTGRGKIKNLSKVVDLAERTRPPGESALHVAGVMYADRAYLHAERLRYGLDLGLAYQLYSALLTRSRHE